MSVLLINPAGEQVKVKDNVADDRLANGWQLPKKPRKGAKKERVNNGRTKEKRSDAV